MQRFLLREIMLRTLPEKTCAATRLVNWKFLVQLDSALFARSLGTLSLSVFRSQNCISLRKGRIFRSGVSPLPTVVLLMGKVKNWFWNPVLRHICSVNFKMFLRTYVWMLITMFHSWKSNLLPNFFAWQARWFSLFDFLWLSFCYNHSLNLLNVSAFGELLAKVVLWTSLLW